MVVVVFGKVTCLSSGFALPCLRYQLKSKVGQVESLDARSEFVEAIESRSLHGTEWYCLPRFRQPELKVGISRILRRVCQEYGYDGRQFADGPTVDRGP